MEPDQLQAAARDHLWMHFTRMSSYQNAEVPIIGRGEGPYVYDAQGRRYLDALGGLFVSQLGHGRKDLAEAAANKAAERAYLPLGSQGPRRGGSQAGRGAGLLPALVLRAPAGDRARGPDCRAAAGRSQPRLLHQRRRRGGRDGLEALEEL